jgi:steroid delta-isomerase-like uncharacterized protein
MNQFRARLSACRVIAALLLLAGCSRSSAPISPAAVPAPTGRVAAAPASTAPTPAARDSRSERATLDQYLAAWNAHDSAAAAALLTDDSEYFDASFAGRQVGRAAIEEKAINVFLRGLPDLHWEMRSEPIVGEDAIAYEWTLSGTNTGTWGGIPATGQKIGLKGVSLVRFRNGRISYQSVVYDSATLNRQLGL